jgi:hypothetical protein
MSVKRRRLDRTSQPDALHLAQSRKPNTESLGIDSRSVLASSRLQTGVLPFLTTYLDPERNVLDSMV